MRVRDPEAKKRQLLGAALTEFAAKGLAGSRIDAIATRANVSAGLVYTYFGSKEALFDAVLDDITATTINQIPIDANDLPGYAVRLHDMQTANPEIERFVAWYQLERDVVGERDAVADAMAGKIEAVEAAQKAGTLPAHISASQLVLGVQAIAGMWQTEHNDVCRAIEGCNDEEARREAVRTLVSALIGGGHSG
ncbi:MAG: TetR family transcriptional regulator [Corynebacterium sp.]|nr:TetR family transcriptional regulator [Corynebacterium sp.]